MAQIDSLMFDLLAFQNLLALNRGTELMCIVAVIDEIVTADEPVMLRLHKSNNDVKEATTKKVRRQKVRTPTRNFCRNNCWPRSLPNFAQPHEQLAAVLHACLPIQSHGHPRFMRAAMSIPYPWEVEIDRQSRITGITTKGFALKFQSCKDFEFYENGWYGRCLCLYNTITNRFPFGYASDLEELVQGSYSKLDGRDCCAVWPNNKYLDEYGTQLSKTELRKLFNKGKMQEVLQEFLTEDVEIAIDTEQHGVLFLKLKRPLKEALASQPKVATNLVPASKEGGTASKIVPLLRPIGHSVEEVHHQQNDDDEQKLMADLGLVQQKKLQNSAKTDKSEVVLEDNLTTARNLPKKKEMPKIPILTDSEDEEVAEEEGTDGLGTEPPRDGERGRADLDKLRQQRLASNAAAKSVEKGARVSHAEKYILRVKQNREEQSMMPRGRDASRQPVKTKNESSEDEEAEDERANAKEWTNRNGNSANGPTANEKQKIGELTKYDRYLYSAVISTFMHVHKSITISKLHNYLSENYSNGNLFRSVFPDQSELLEFVRANCKNIRCTEVSANEIALLWNEDSEQQMVRLLLKVGKVLMLNEVAYAD
uniref:DUF7516 domain-containing protein n=1 Tax=Globodera rostochiensis TaxID=31243 RepID=A0A914HXF9_GLORO